MSKGEFCMNKVALVTGSSRGIGTGKFHRLLQDCNISNK